MCALRLREHVLTMPSFDCLSRNAQIISAISFEIILDFISYEWTQGLFFTAFWKRTALEYHAWTCWFIPWGFREFSEKHSPGVIRLGAGKLSDLISSAQCSVLAGTWIGELERERKKVCRAHICCAPDGSCYFIFCGTLSHNSYCISSTLVLTRFKGEKSKIFWGKKLGEYNIKSKVLSVPKLWVFRVTILIVSLQLCEVHYNMSPHYIITQAQVMLQSGQQIKGPK